MSIGVANTGVRVKLCFSVLLFSVAIQLFTCK